MVSTDDGQYTGEIIKYKTKSKYALLGSHEPHPTSQLPVCLFTHVSIDQLLNVVDLAVNWPSFLSVALYIHNATEEATLDNEFERFKTKISDQRIISRIDVSILYGYTYMASHDEIHQRYDFLYPINALRNLALKNCASEYVFHVDFDFIVSADALPVARSYIKTMLPKPNGRSSPLALVIQPFQWTARNAEMSLLMGTKQYIKLCGGRRLIPMNAKSTSIGTNQNVVDWCKGKIKRPIHFQFSRPEDAPNYEGWQLQKHSILTLRP